MFSESDLPASYQDADCASRLTQARYLHLFRGILISTVLGAVSVWLARTVVAYTLALGYGATVFAIISLVTTLVLKERRYENSWYMGRAVAESIKTRSWSYMMRARPYTGIVDEAEASKSFIRDIGAILKEKGPLILTKQRTGHETEISEVMRQIRSSSLEERKALYLKERIGDQERWYGSKAAISGKKESNVFFSVIGIQCLAVIVAMYALIWNHAPSGLVGVLASFSSAALAWLQVKKYQETAQSYSVTSQELGLVEALARSVVTEDQFAAFVEDAESAISREHTLWIARRTSR